MPVPPQSCDPKVLAAEAKCFLDCIPPGMQAAVQTYLLAQIAGGSMDPKVLANEARCFLDCIPPGMQRAVQAKTLCDILNAGGNGGESRGDGTFGLFSFGDSGAIGDVVINDTVCVPGYDIEHEPNITSVSFPNLVAVDPLNVQAGVFSLYSNPALANLTAPLLTIIGGSFFFVFSPMTITLSLPELITVGSGFNCYGNPALTTVNLPKWVPTDATIISFTGDALNAASVELILRRCVLAGVTTCTIDLSGGTNAGTASLNAQGQADVVTLGAQLTINP